MLSGEAVVHIEQVDAGVPSDAEVDAGVVP